MLIGLISDTHDNMPEISRAVDYFNSAELSLVLHAGDLVSPFTAKEFKRLKVPLYAVFGNNDGEKKLWPKIIEGWGNIAENYYETDVAGQKILLIHEPFHMDALAISQEYDVIVYGHTHKIDKHMVGKTLVINPGECCGWITGKCTVALLNLPEKKVEFKDLKQDLA